MFKESISAKGDTTAIKHEMNEKARTPYLLDLIRVGAL
jgi:hypothetical protein